MVMRSMEKGRKRDTVQYGTTRRTRSTLTELWEASPESGRDLVFSTGGVKGRYVATRNPSEGRWFQKFNHGMKVRMGDEVSQDRAFSAAILRELLNMFEAEWRRDLWRMSLHSISTCMFLLVACLGGMRGYEVMWTDLAALIYDIAYCEELGDYEAVVWPIVGRFKARGGIADCYMVPIAGLTRSGITFFVWTQRFVGRLALEGIDSGWAFRMPDGSRAVAGYYRDCLFSKLEKIQQTTDLIDPDCDVWTAYGMQRSGRRYFTTECIIQGINQLAIEMQCRWSVDRANGERTVQRSMIHTYAEVRNMKEVLIRPSKAH